MTAITVKVHVLGEPVIDSNGKPVTDKGEPVLGKGTLSVYGNAPRPWVTLYANQWEELGKVMPAILARVAKGKKDGHMAGPPAKKPGASKSGRETL